MVGLLCRTPQKESRQELLRRVAAGGGVFKSKNDIKVHVPAANLNDIANQADDILEVITANAIFCISAFLVIDDICIAYYCISFWALAANFPLFRVVFCHLVYLGLLELL